MSLDLTKKVKTRDGREARIVFTQARGSYPVVALITSRDGKETAYLYTEEGVFEIGTENHAADLVSVVETIDRTVWVNVYHHDGTQIHCTREAADAAALPDRVACIPVRVICNVGEGL